MKVLLTGATGFVGRSLATELFHGGHTVIGLSRDPKRARAQFDFPISFFPWDAQEAAPPNAFEGVDAVIHLAGESIADKRWSAPQKEKIRTSRILGTRNLLEGIRQSPHEKPAHFICASAIGFYGDGKDEILTEGSAPGTGFLPDICRAWEEEAEKAENLGIRTAMIRIGVVLGRDGGALAKMIPIFKSGLAGPLGSGKQWMSWIHLGDLVRLFRFVLENPKLTGPINGVSPHAVTNEAFTHALARALHRPALIRAPAFALKVAMGEMADFVLTGANILPAAAVAAGFSFTYPQIEGALAEEVVKKKRPSRVRNLKVEQWLVSPVDVVFPFFADEKNLEILTPSWLKFTVLGKSTPEMRAGTLIDYRLVVHGMPIRWRTVISNWTERRVFVDEQLRGPYRYWHHTHRFEARDNGTLVTDSVDYALPGGKIGDWLLGWWVKRDVEMIFQFRTQAIAKLFGGGEVKSSLRR